MLLFRTCVCLPIFSVSQTTMNNSFNVTKTSKQYFYDLVQRFVKNDRLECKNTITASRTYFVSWCVSNDKLRLSLVGQSNETNMCDQDVNKFV